MSTPCVGLTSFLRKGKETNEKGMLCQCPVSGLPHFYAHQAFEQTMRIPCVNALCRTHLISTKDQRGMHVRWQFCVKALCRAHLISTYRVDDLNVKREILCQCPVSGSPHFYMEKSIIRKFLSPRCQCPVSGLSHFYKIMATLKVRIENGCQCPVSG